MARDNRRVIVRWLGDISFNEQWCSPHYHEGFRSHLARLTDEAEPADLRVGNFEAPIWGDGRTNPLKNPRLCTTRQAAECILPLKLDLVFLGNNHIYDCLEKGFENTISFLKENNIRYIGAGKSPSEASRPVVLERNGLSLGILNYVHPSTNPSLPSEAGVFLNEFDDARVLGDISRLSEKVDVVVVYLHWGEEELLRLPSCEQRRFGRKAVEAGAKVVVFDHAHCLQPFETWHEGCILYGLGNFIFGSIPGQDWPPHAWQTAMANIELSVRRVVHVHFTYLSTTGGLPEWDRKAGRRRSHNRLNMCMGCPDAVYRLVYSGEKFYQRVLVDGMQFVKRSGGILPSITRIRARHAKKFLGLLLKRARASNRGQMVSR